MACHIQVPNDLGSIWNIKKQLVKMFFEFHRPSTEEINASQIKIVLTF